MTPQNSFDEHTNTKIEPSSDSSSCNYYSCTSTSSHGYDADIEEDGNDNDVYSSCMENDFLNTDVDFESLATTGALTEPDADAIVSLIDVPESNAPLEDILVLPRSHSCSSFGDAPFSFFAKRYDGTNQTPASTHSEEPSLRKLGKFY